MAETVRKRKWLRVLLIVLAAIVFIVIVFLIGAFILFNKELTIFNSMEKISGDKDIYYMEVNGYYDDEIFAHGISSDDELAEIVAQKISKGFYTPEKPSELNVGCSVISGLDADGKHCWGRNFDWYGTSAIILRAAPENAYASISTVAFSNITDIEAPEGIEGKMLAIASYYVPMDGINEKGLCIADLEVNEGGMENPDTEKPDLTITTAIRLLLNKAATVDEAVTLLKQHDIHPSAGMSHHLAISDATGASVVVEFIGADMVVTDTDYVTNFCVANGDKTAGGESSEKRYDTLVAASEDVNNILDFDIVLNTLKSVAQTEGKSKTKWSVVYTEAEKSLTIYFDCDYSTPYTYTVVK